MENIKVVKKERNFTQVDNGFLNDARLSLRAKGLLTVLLSKTPDWKANPKGLVKQNKDGEDSIKAAFAELRLYHYAHLELWQGEKGRWLSRWIIFEHPDLNTNPPFIPKPKRKRKKKEAPKGELPTSVQPPIGDTDFGGSHSKILNTNLPKIKEEYIHTDKEIEKEKSTYVVSQEKVQNVFSVDSQILKAKMKKGFSKHIEPSQFDLDWNKFVESVLKKYGKTNRETNVWGKWFSKWINQDRKLNPITKAAAPPKLTRNPYLDMLVPEQSKRF